MMTKNYDVVILGAGVAGLSAADEVLRNRKDKVLVLEKEDYWGGLATTINDGGFSYDLAPHRWFTKNEELNKWIDDLMGSELIWVNKYTPMYQFDNFFEYPIKISDVLKKINPLMSVFMVSSYVLEKIKSKVAPRKVRTMKDAYVSRFGLGLYKWFNEEYNEKLWGKGGCESMSADFVNQRVKNLSMVTAILNALGIGKNKVISLVDKFRFPTMGIGRISDNLADRIKKNGGEIKLNEPVVGIKKIAGGYEIVTVKGTYTTKKIISSIPINVFLSNFGGKIFSNIEKEVKKLKFVSQKIVVLKAKGNKLTDFTWVYVHPKKIKTFRFMETNNWSDKMSPKGKTSLVFEYPYHLGDEIDKMSDKELIEITIDDFLKYFTLKKIRRSDILDGKVYQVPFAYPKYDFKYAKALKNIYKYTDKNLKQVQLIGRNGMFHYNNLDHSIYTGILAGRNYIKGKAIYDLRKVNNEAEYLEEIKRK